MKEKIPLLKGEKIIESIKPLCRVKAYWIVEWFFSIFILVAIFLFILFVRLESDFPYIFSIFGKILIVLLFIIFVIMLVYSFLRYKWENYWITNKRIIKRSGFIGYSYYSVPLERISDVIVGRNFLERIFGFGSLHFQTLAGQLTGKWNKRGAEVSFLGLSDPERFQKLVLELIEEKRKREKLSF